MERAEFVILKANSGERLEVSLERNELYSPLA